MIAALLRKIWGWFSQESKPKKYKLEIEMVPFTMHGANVRSRLDPEQWKKICKVVHRAANLNSTNGLRCQICGGSGKAQGFSHPVECHEIWTFSPDTHIQSLKGMISLCPMCHKAKHYGLAVNQGYEDKVRAHLMKVNRLSPSQLDEQVAQATAVVKERSQHEWQLDLTYLNRRQFGFLMIDFTEDEKHKCDEVVF
jgi:hypothetical protein